MPVTKGLLWQVVNVAAGEEHSVVRTCLGHVYTWGSNAHDQLGRASTHVKSPPKWGRTLGALGRLSLLQIMGDELLRNGTCGSLFSLHNVPFSRVHTHAIDQGAI